MKNLIAFLKKFQVFLLFVALQVFAIYLYVNNFNTPQTKLITSINQFNSYVLNTSNDVSQYLHTPHFNQQLQDENKELREEIDRLQQLLDTTHFIDTLFNDTVFQYIPAKVIYSTHNKRNNFITINKGSKDGLKEGMGVFTNKAIVGVIHSVSDNYSLIKSVLSAKIYIDVKIAKNGAYGLLNWDGKKHNIGAIDGISSDIPLEKWSRVVTRGASGVFPPDLYVGKISNFQRDGAKSMWNIDLWYEEDFRKITNVYVVKSTVNKELEELMNTIPNEFN